MKVCPHCGNHNVPTSLRCFLCGAPLDASETPDIKLHKLKSKKQSKFYRFVAPANRLLTALAPRLPQRAHGKPTVRHREVALAVALSVLPGLGHIYNRHYGRAALLFALFALPISLAVATLHNNASNWFVGAALLIALYAMQDAAGTTRLINGRTWTFPGCSAVVFYILFASGIVAVLCQMGIVPLCRVAYVSHDALSPTFQKGDYVLIDSVTLLFRYPRRGELVYYHPSRGFSLYYTAEGQSASKEYFVRPRVAFERIIGFPRDVIESRNKTLYLNGKRMDDMRCPLVRDQILTQCENFSLEVPQDYYGIFLSAVPAGKTALYRFCKSQGTSAKRRCAAEEKIQAEDLHTLIAGSAISSNWLEACLVNKNDILGRPIAIISPPKRRSSLR